MKATMNDGVVFEGTPIEIKEFFGTPHKAKRAKPKPHKNGRKVKRKCKTRARAHNRWSTVQDIKLVRGLKEGMSIKKLSKSLGRTIQAIRARSYVLKNKGLVIKDTMNGKERVMQNE